MAKAWANVETQAVNTIQAGERDEVNPWVERTQWLPYLVGMERPELMACVEEPVSEPDPRLEQQAKPVEAAIWAAMDGLARFSQASVIHRVGVFVRLEAVTVWALPRSTLVRVGIADVRSSIYVAQPLSES